MDKILCRHCGETKPITEFKKSKNTKSGYSQPCKKCAYELYRKKYLADERGFTPRANAKFFYNVLIRYGITREQYEAMYDRQEGLCGICKKPESSKTRRRLCVDHNHKTGEVRGLLCSRCNLMLGRISDDPIVFENAAKYLRYSV